jgi:hypothetical protein
MNISNGVLLWEWGYICGGNKGVSNCKGPWQEALTFKACDWLKLLKFALY